MAAIAVFMMMAVACAPVFAVIAEDKGTSAAPADVSAITDVETQIFTAESKDFSDLIYRSDKLPATLDATEWVQNTSVKTWINVNEKSPDCGEILRYGATGMTNAEIITMNDLQKEKLPLIQTTFLCNAESTLTMTVRHANVDKTDVDISGTYLTKLGYTFKSAVGATFNSLSELTTVTGDALRGDYQVTIFSNGVVAKQTTVVYGAADLALTGKITDAGTTPVNGATVNYTVNGTAMSTKCLADAYTIKAQPGSVVVITGIIATGYTFKEVTPGVLWNFGNISAAAAKDFKANETTAVITVNDAGSALVAGANVTATWYFDNAGYIAGNTDGKVTVLGVTAADGTVKVTYIAPKTLPVQTGITFQLNEAKIVISATNAPGYTFKTVGINTGAVTGAIKPITTQITGSAGMALLSSTTGTVKANEFTAVITVNDATTKLVAGANVTATWYFDNAGYIAGNTDGNVTVLGVTAADGTVKVTYIAPKTLPVQTGITFQLNEAKIVISATNAPGYTFKTVGINTGAVKDVGTITTQITGFTGMALLSSTTGTVKAVETAYTVSGAIAGLNGKIATVSYTNGIGTSVLCDATGKYSFNVIVGNSPVITVTCAGYTFAPVSVTVPTVTANVTVNFTATAIPSITFVTPTTLGTFTTKVVADKTVVTFEYTVGAKTYKSSLIAKDNTGIKSTLKVYGVSGSTVSSITATAPGYVGNLLNGTNVEKTVVTFNGDNVKTDKPVSVSINYTYDYAGKTVTGTVKTDANGVGKIVMPNTVTNVKFTSGVFILDEINPAPTTLIGDYFINAHQAYAPAGKYTVSVDHVSTYAQSNPAVPSAPIGGGDVLMNVGDKVSLYAPEYNGYTFKCWMLNGTSIGTDRTIDFTLTQKVLDASDKDDPSTDPKFEDVTLQAVYSATPVFAPSAGIDNMTLIIGIIAVVIALLAVVYTVISLKKE